MNPIRHWAFAVVLSLAVNGLPAQDPPAPAPGDRVRVTSADRRATGTLESIDGDTIVVRRSNGALTKFARAPRPRLDVSTGVGMCGQGRRAACVIGGFLGGALVGLGAGAIAGGGCNGDELCGIQRSEEHTSELHSLAYLVCRLLLEKKKRSPPAISSLPQQPRT